MTRPRGSVLMMVHNAAPYLRRAIESVLQQDGADFELLIVDDASTDASPTIIDEFRGDPRLRLIALPTHRGVRHARAMSLGKAEGEFIAVLDADDVALPDRLRAQTAYLDAHPETLAVGGQVQIIDEQGLVQSTVPVPTDPLAIRWGLLFGNCLPHSAAMFRREAALAAGGYDEQVLSGEDFDLWVRLASRGPLAQIPRPLAQWRRHSASLYHREPAAVKDHLLHTVSRSVALLTGQRIDRDTARALFRNLPQPAPTTAVFAAALAVVERCLDCLVVSTGAARRPVGFALAEILRLARLNPTRSHTAWRAAVRCSRRHSWIGFVNASFWRLTLRAWLPAPLVSRLQRWRAA